MSSELYSEMKTDVMTEGDSEKIRFSIGEPTFWKQHGSRVAEKIGSRVGGVGATDEVKPIRK